MEISRHFYEGMVRLVDDTIDLYMEESKDKKEFDDRKFCNAMREFIDIEYNEYPENKKVIEDYRPKDERLKSKFEKLLNDTFDSPPNEMSDNHRNFKLSATSLSNSLPAKETDQEPLMTGLNNLSVSSNNDHNHHRSK